MCRSARKSNTCAATLVFGTALSRNVFGTILAIKKRDYRPNFSIFTFRFKKPKKKLILAIGNCFATST